MAEIDLGNSVSLSTPDGGPFVLNILTSPPTLIVNGFGVQSDGVPYFESNAQDVPVGERALLALDPSDPNADPWVVQ